MDDLPFLDATELLERLRSRALRSVDLVEASIERIEAHDSRINAVVTRDFERARALAREADEALDRGDSSRTLLGLPMTIKDTHEVAGLRTTAGAPVLAEHRPDRSSVAVERLQHAGAIVLGKTNTPLFAGDCQSYNAIFGTTRNPWDLERTPGGSSGGAAAALAAGFTPLELGSDIGGSIRNPAHFCGVFGHKPTWGIVPDRGHIPGPPGQLAPTDLGVLGPMARSARDLALMLDVVAGGEESEAGGGWRLELAAPRSRDLRTLRVAAWLDDEFSPVDPEYRALLERAAARLEEAGAKVDRSARPEIDFGQSFAVYALLLHSVLAAGFPDDVCERLAALASNADPEDRDHRILQARGVALSHRRWIAFDEQRMRIGAAWSRFLRDFDAILLPVHPTVATPHDHEPDFHARTIEVGGRTRPYLDFLHWVSLATVCGLPATVAPIGRTASGLPAGVQIVGERFDDRSTIQLAGWLSEQVGGFEPPPGFGSEPASG